MVTDRYYIKMSRMQTRTLMILNLYRSSCILGVSVLVQQLDYK
jgi:hypothetical protein